MFDNCSPKVQQPYCHFCLHTPRAFLFFFFLFFSTFVQAQTHELKSPDGRIMVNISIGDAIRYSVQFDSMIIIKPSAIGLQLPGGTLGRSAKLKNATRGSSRRQITPPVPIKRNRIHDHYNEITLRFRNDFSLIFRAYDDGIAYRFQTFFRDSIYIKDEITELNFNANHPVYFTAVEKRDGVDIFHTSFEEPYQFKPIDSIHAGHLIFSPTLVKPVQGPGILITESDLEDYPGMFLTGTGTTTLRGRFAPFPLEEKITEGEFPQSIVTRRADYIARTRGERKFPWRVMVIAPQDKLLPFTDIVYRLAAPSRIGDATWIRPGKGTDEWIIGINLFNVPFKTGVNTATYKFYIDFARRFGFDRIMMDAGWSDYRDLFKINPQIDMDEIADYARKQGIRLSMWTLAHTLDKQLEPALEQFNKWGVDFIMTDFMDRDDQPMVNFYYRVAEACARHKIMVMYHGAFKPAGFERTFPNAITREGVLGSEYNIWSEKATPRHNLLLPFIRMVSGPMDYEPGILDNATQKTFRPIGEKVMAPGTRCHQLAMFVVYESPIQLFSGNPSTGIQEPLFMQLLGSIPTTWDDTRIIDGKIGEFIITARKKGEDWYMGAMTNWTARDLETTLDFLGPGNFEAEICEDGINADRYASDYKISRVTVNAKTILSIKMAPGGGYMVRFKKQ